MKTYLFLRLRLQHACTLLLLALCILSFAACGEETFDHDNPEVTLFVKQLKSGTYSVEGQDSLNAVPRFTMEHVGELLEYVDDLSNIPAFPLATVSYATDGKLRLGECILWTIEIIRLGYNASMGCKMVHNDADDYEGIYFLTDAEVLDAAARYRRWWEGRKYPHTMWTVDTCRDEPLCGSEYMWW